MTNDKLPLHNALDDAIPFTPIGLGKPQASRVYWAFVRGIAQRALAKFGSGPVIDFVQNTKTRNSEYFEKVRCFVLEEVNNSTWIIKNPLLVLDFSGYESASAFESMQMDVKEAASALLSDYIPDYHQLRIGSRFVFLSEFDNSDVEDYESPYRCIDSRQIEEAITRLTNEYKQARLPVPKIEIVAFNKKRVEIPNQNIIKERILVNEKSN